MAIIKILSRKGEIISISVQESVEYIWSLLCGNEEFSEKRIPFFIQLTRGDGTRLIVQTRYFYLVEEDHEKKRQTTNAN